MTLRTSSEECCLAYDTVLNLVTFGQKWRRRPADSPALSPSVSMLHTIR